jgi:hypothetical protein
MLEILIEWHVSTDFDVGNEIRKHIIFRSACDSEIKLHCKNQLYDNSKLPLILTVSYYHGVQLLHLRAYTLTSAKVAALNANEVKSFRTF